MNYYRIFYRDTNTNKLLSMYVYENPFLCLEYSETDWTYARKDLMEIGLGIIVTEEIPKYQGGNFEVWQVEIGEELYNANEKGIYWNTLANSIQDILNKEDSSWAWDENVLITEKIKLIRRIS